MFISPQNSFDEILIPSVMILRGGAFGRFSSYEGRDCMCGSSALTKETPESSLAPLLCECKVKKWPPIN